MKSNYKIQFIPTKWRIWLSSYKRPGTIKISPSLFHGNLSYRSMLRYFQLLFNPSIFPLARYFINSIPFGTPLDSNVGEGQIHLVLKFNSFLLMLEDLNLIENFPPKLLFCPKEVPYASLVCNAKHKVRQSMEGHIHNTCLRHTKSLWYVKNMYYM